jgi:outer membrane lipoprotein-sorting protein
MKLRASRREFLAALAAAPAFAALPAFAADPPLAQPLSQADQADVARAEAYLNGVHTISARFLQVGQNGGTAEGQFYLSRPGKLRLEYDPPVPILMVADGNFLIHYDKSLKTIAYIPINSTPAGVLVRDKISLSGDLTVMAVERGPAALRITVVQTKDPRAGRIMLVFSDRPMQLTNWTVIDGQGQTTRVSLADAKTDVPIDPAVFRFTPPPQNRMD